MAKTASRKVYITGSAYVLKVTNNLSGAARSVKISIEVVGTKESSKVNYTVRLRRGTTDISSHPRTGTVPPQRTRSESFTNVRNEGKLNVNFQLEKKGGTPGLQVAQINVP